MNFRASSHRRRVARFFFFQAEDGIRDYKVTGVQTCALPISDRPSVRDAELPSAGSPLTRARPLLSRSARGPHLLRHLRVLDHVSPDGRGTSDWHGESQPLLLSPDSASFSAVLLVYLNHRADGSHWRLVASARRRLARDDLHHQLPPRPGLVPGARLVAGGGRTILHSLAVSLPQAWPIACPASSVRLYLTRSRLAAPGGVRFAESATRDWRDVLHHGRWHRLR